MKIWMVTENQDKYREAKGILSQFKMDLVQLQQKKLEIQADNISEIASYSIEKINVDRPIIVEDAGIFLDYYNGFPGPYSNYVRRTIGVPGILKLMKGVENRNSSYRSVVVYKYNKEKQLFQGKVDGTIAFKIRGTEGFGCDPIFIPDEGDGRTFGEMNEEEKNTISHRARAFKSLGEWLASS